MQLQLSGTLQFLAGLTALLMVAALTFKELMPKEVDQVWIMEDTNRAVRSCYRIGHVKNG